VVTQNGGTKRHKIGPESKKRQDFDIGYRTEDRERARVLKYLEVGVIAVALVCLGEGVAAANPVPVADVNQFVDTADGFHFSSSLTNVTINSVPNMAATAFTREAFVSATAVQTIADSNIPVNALTVTEGRLDVAVQLGCQIDLKDGVTIGFNTDETLALENVLDTVITAAPTFNDFVPNIQTTLKPGTITYVRLGRQFLSPEALKTISDSDVLPLRITVRDAHIKVDGCGGPVSARVLAVAQMRTQTSFDELNLYSDILSI
jgi:MspA